MAKLQLRIADDFDARLNEAAKRVGWTKSQYVRFLLETALGDDARLSVLDQIVWSLNAKLQRRLADVGRVLRTELERILLEPDEDE